MSFLGINSGVLVGTAIMTLEALSFYSVFAAGQFNGAQPAFMAVGAYAVALCALHHVPLLVGAVVGLLVASLVGCVVGLATARLAGVYLAIATITLVELAQQLIINVRGLEGASGIYGIPREIGPLYAWLIVGGMFAIAHRLFSSRLGHAMRFIKDDRVSARSLGVSERRVKVFAVVLSAVIAAVAGEIDAMSTSYISPDEFGFAMVIAIIGYVVVGGTERYWGCVLGAVFFSLLNLYTRASFEYEEIISGAVILAVLLVWPTGAAGFLVWLRRRFRLRLTTSTREAPTATLSELITRTVAASASAPAIAAVGVGKRFGGVTAVQDVRIEAVRGRILGLIGPNGAGKSTLIDLLSGEQRVDSGELSVAGDDVTRLGAYRRARLGVARTFQNTRLPHGATVSDILYGTALIADNAPIAGHVFGFPEAGRQYRAARQRAHALRAAVGLLAETEDRVTNELTWREQRTLEVARSLALRPSVLMLDEPTAGMDATAVDEFAELVREIAASGVAVVIVEHNVPFMAYLADELVAMDTGSVIAAGDPRAVLREPAVVESYLGEPLEPEKEVYAKP